MKKIVLKVSILCSKCKVCILTTISKFEVDVEKSTVTIVGVVDAVLIVKALRKAKKPAEIVSVGEPDKKKEEKKDDKEDPCKLPPCCNACRPVMIWQDEPNICTIC